MTAPEAPARSAREAPANRGAVSRGGPDRRTLAAAGGYDAQRALLSPAAGEREDDDRSRPTADLAGPAQASRGPGTGFPRTAALRTLEARVMAKPGFVGASVADLRRGHEVVLLGADGAWYRCRAPNGREGWIHRNHVDERVIRLRPGDTGSGTIRGQGGDDTMSGRG